MSIYIYIYMGQGIISCHGFGDGSLTFGNYQRHPKQPQKTTVFFLELLKFKFFQSYKTSQKRDGSRCPRSVIDHLVVWELLLHSSTVGFGYAIDVQRLWKLYDYLVESCFLSDGLTPFKSKSGYAEHFSIHRRPISRRYFRCGGAISFWDSVHPVDL